MSQLVRYRQKRAWAKSFKKQAPMRAIQGDGNGTFTVPGYEQLCYVRPWGSEIPIIVSKGGTSELEGLDVYIGNDGSRPGTRILGAYNGSGSNPYYMSVPEHALTHFWGGSDALYIMTVQITDFLVYAGTGLEVKVKAGCGIMGGQPFRVSSSTVDLTAHVPATGALYVLVRVNSAGVISIQDGTPVATLNVLDFNTDIPAVAEGYAALAAVRLYEGQTQISKAYASPDVTDLRFAVRGTMTIALGDLTNVTITAPADNEVLAYDNGSSLWINQTPAEAGLSVVGHTHVETDITDLDHDAQKIKGVPVTAPNAGNDQQAIIYDDTSGTFIYGDTGGGGGGDLYWYADGALAIATGVDKQIVAPYDMTISNVIINVKTKGSANTTTIDININGVSIFAVPPTIAWNDADGIVEILATTVDIAKDDVITMDIDAVATGAAGLTVCVVVSNASVVDTVPSLRAIMRRSFR